MLGLCVALHLLVVTKCPGQQSAPETTNESTLLTGTRQLTFEGKRAGEGYFSATGKKMVFQSERRPDNPFFQIFLLDMETGDIDPVSPGHGKTTCAWVSPDDKRVLYASTQNDPDAVQKQLDEIAFRESGESRRYSWDYDENYELFSWDSETGKYTQLTSAKGYDAEGSWSPDGTKIAFASNRLAYSKKLTAKETEFFERDPAYMMDIFIMDADGTNIKQLTDVAGYDGGPFFSPDGKRICWRRFAENGAIAEIMTMNIDGSDQTPLTRMNKMSWAPFYHPSGDYLIFNTNKHGFANFELYLVAADGKSPPVRVTETEGFDGLASFTPDGKQITWTSNRNSKKQSQIYIANWNDAAARKLLGLGSEPLAAAAKPPSGTGRESSDINTAIDYGKKSAAAGNANFRDIDIIRHVDYLCRKELGGRMTGSTGERKATAYVSTYFDYLGLVPAGDNGTWFQAFEFPDGAELGPGNSFKFTVGGKAHDATIDKNWRPVSFSSNAKIENKEVIFCGYGIVAQENTDHDQYDSFAGLDDSDIDGKWVMILRFVPEDVTPERRQHLNFYADLRKKLFNAREKGAAGIIIVSGPTSAVNNQLVPLTNDATPTGSSIPAISITDAIASQWLKSAGKDLAQIQAQLDVGDVIKGFNIPDVTVSASVDVKKVTGTGRNVLGRLQFGDTPSEKVIVVGAHIDHLGTGKTTGSLAKESEKGQPHLGADDNASGIAAMIEIAEYLADQKKKDPSRFKHDIVFAGWSGEELGLFGSKHFAKTWPGLANAKKEADARPDSFHDFNIVLADDGTLKLNGQPTTLDALKKEVAVVVKLDPSFPVTLASAAKAPYKKAAEAIEMLQKQGLKNLTVKTLDDKDLTAGRSVVAALNMDMVGRLEDSLILQGLGSSDAWAGLIESTNAIIGLPVTPNDDTDLPTDASSFYRAGVPILSAFTGSHRDYHTPRDTPEKLNYPDAARIAKLMGLITRKLAVAPGQPAWLKVESKTKPSLRGGLRAYLGTVPDYGADVEGVKLEDVTTGAPAQQSGVRAGDIIIELAGTKIENIYDYTAVIDRLKPGQAVKIKVTRFGEKMTFELIPGSRN